MFNGRKELITINDSVADVKASFPDYTRDVMRNWEQRHGFPKAIIKKSERADCKIEGYVLVQICYCAKIILFEQKTGKTLDEAFRLVDELIKDSLSQISENVFPPSSELKLFKKADFICYKEKLVSLINQLESKVISLTEIDKTEIDKTKSAFLTECSNHIEEYFQPQKKGKPNSDDIDEIESLLSAMQFFCCWGDSRKNSEIWVEAKRLLYIVADEYQRRKRLVSKNKLNYAGMNFWPELEY